MKKGFLGAIAGTAAIASTLLMPGTASAATVYTSDQCSSNQNIGCFVLEYTVSDSWGTGVCFVTNKSEYNHTGRSVTSGATQTTYRYIFERRNWCASIGSGDMNGHGQALRNNAAWAQNRDTRAHTVYYSPGYYGAAKTYAVDQYGLLGSLRNDNASSKRSS
ncbi:hypothetical protein PS783_37710 (plasmid) [Streptomyces enissocaesilis]|uniref:Uncharacterized protein n=1 Tax=Streptomyces rochei TaxID=1928 RepID=A0AAX3ZVZ6_STRRO|nr:hypothetical protein [Streptomyces rochei]WDI23370.1 hypothetical protein PS783_37710 [Streptomyces enissocaesilis]WMC90943.1 hypothetical protein P7W03_35465 [Streptomyces rochei]WMI61948.1 hypothetical protein RBH85_36420 [Streptomyces rochei]